MALLKNGDAILVENAGCRLMMFHIGDTPIVNEKEMILTSKRNDVRINIDFYLTGESQAENIYLLIRSMEEAE
jgi:hypothetical protein